MSLPRLSIRKTRWTLLFAFLIYTALLVRDSFKGSKHEEAIESINRILAEGTRNLLSSMAVRKKLRPSIANMQNALSCLVQRRDLTSEYSPNKTCSSDASSFNLEPDASTRICDYLGGKRIVFVGPLTTYHLHDLWLEALQAHEGHSLTCPGPEFCIFHHICYPDRNGTFYSDSDRQRFPKNQELRNTRSAVLQYVLSSSLIAHSDKDSYLYTRPVMDPRTNVRMRNYYWLRKARKANVLVLSQAPIPAPPETYTQYFKREQNSMTYFSVLPGRWQPVQFQEELVALALNTTMNVFLPSLRDAIHAIRTDNEIRNTLKIWHGHWPLDPNCTNSGLPSGVPRWHNFGPRIAMPFDPWTFYYNLQGGTTFHLTHKLSTVFPVYMHDQILPNLLPYFDVLYLPIAVVTGKDKVSQVIDERKDCARGARTDLESAFFSGLSYILKSADASFAT
ncbi:hypothetical protein NMY22_g110 [Coprinellus aureogranulatus]|nr:hypothetical protein NMY22_g110 [Coprinellus aureogranulatus]